MRYASTATVGPRIGISWLAALYLIIGAIVAATHHYWSNLHTLKAIVSATRAYAPIPGIGVCGVTTLPPAASTFLIVAFTDATPT